MEIKFEQDGLKFNVRSSCIIKDKEHKQVLLSDMRGVKTHKAYIYILPQTDSSNNK